MISDDVLVSSAAIVGGAILFRGGLNLFRWQRDLGRQADATNRLLNGDPKMGWPGVMDAHNQLISRVNGIQVDLGEAVGRIRAVEKLVSINGLGSPGIGDAVGRIEERLSGDTRQETLDQRKPQL